ncbi:MAG: hypothetical protein KME40_14115 [Komarekiella atlantica HA4396-MV6]|jgi:hypothetical protein|nr:hypothetical protein [Komarekiella atlantica HA4396-MV6]
MLAHRYIVVVGMNCAIALSNIESGGAQVINYLNPSFNLLKFLSLPEEVKLQANQAITLQQAL